VFSQRTSTASRFAAHLLGVDSAAILVHGPRRITPGATLLVFKAEIAVILHRHGGHEGKPVALLGHRHSWAVCLRKERVIPAESISSKQPAAQAVRIRTTMICASAALLYYRTSIAQTVGRQFQPNAATYLARAERNPQAGESSLNRTKEKAVLELKACERGEIARSKDMVMSPPPATLLVGTASSSVAVLLAEGT
jgi:hypothetical protein